jgi:hypothetical protein
MYPSAAPLGGANRSQPRLGILVDYRPCRAKSGNAVPGLTQRAVLLRFWSLGALAGGFLFLVSLTMGVLLGGLASPPEPEPAPAEPRIAMRPKIPVSRPAPAKQEPKAEPAAAPEGNLAKAPPPSPPQVTKSVDSAELTSPAAGPQSSTKIEIAQEESAVKEPIRELAKEAALKSEGETCPTGTCKAGSGDFFGTAVTFLATPKLAGEQAEKDQKLQFLLHVSGNFEDPGFT